MDEEISELKKELQLQQDILSDVQGRIGGLRKKIALLTCPYEIGQLFKNRSGETAKLTEIVPSNNRDYGMRGVYLRKDGTVARNPGRREGPRNCDFRDWDRWEPIE